MEDLPKALGDLVQTLKRERDELRLELKLAGMEFRDHWDEAEIKWQRLEYKLEGVGLEAADTIEQIAREIAQSYRRMRDILKR